MTLPAIVSVSRDGCTLCFVRGSKIRSLHYEVALVLLSICYMGLSVWIVHCVLGLIT